ncbi:hypothetical protein [Streptacidiphilus rugosus]|uniref:hypothetical protein n=1 Tax=Streptacidiphilus rugosus TaxID=405783 RepID=UPI00055C9504|nr:hypothetical protein [Streptacidiphilus rugosus]
MNADIEAINDLVGPLLGRPAWNVRVGVGSNLSLEFGGPTTPYADGVVFGEWHLWVSMAAWRLDGANGVIAGSEDPRASLESAAQMLEGRVLTAVDVQPPGLETVFEFESLGVHVFPLFSRPQSTDPLASWMLWMPSGRILSVGPGSSWSVEEAKAGPG